MAKKKATARSARSVPPRQRTCGAMQQHFHLLETYPRFRANLVALEHATQMRLSAPAVTPMVPHKITVVVHVVHNPAVPSERISVAQVSSQIAILNRDYRAANPDKSKAALRLQELGGRSHDRIRSRDEGPRRPSHERCHLHGHRSNRVFRPRQPRQSQVDGRHSPVGHQEILEHLGLHARGRTSGVRSVSRRSAADGRRRHPEHGLRHHGECRHSLQPRAIRNARDRTFLQLAPYLG